MRQRRGSIRTSMLLAFLPAILVSALAGLFSFAASRVYLRETDLIVGRSVRMASLAENLDRVSVSLESYLASRHFESLNAYLQAAYELRGKAAGLDRRPSRNEGRLILKDLGNLLDSYLDSCDAALAARRGRDTEAYIAAYRQAGKTASWVDRYIDRYNRLQVAEQARRYALLSRRIATAQYASLGLLLLLAALGLAWVAWASGRMTDPLARLAVLADRVSQGDYGAGSLHIATGDEIEVLADSFDRMVGSVRASMEELRGKAALQERLKEEETRSLRMAGLLREAELQALQSQINPHFIFNTLNAGVQLAMFEEAPRTGRFMDELARLLRYNLRGLGEPARLRDELANARDYLSILGTRFADRIAYREEVEEEALDAPMPRMILQPLLENACIHGIGQREEGGSVAVAARVEGGRVLVTVSDDGVGMSGARAASLLRPGGTGGEAPASPPPARGGGHVSGIGLANVIARLRLFTGREDAISIESVEGGGTAITLSLDRGGPA